MVDVPVDLLDDASAQSSLLQHAAAMLVDGVLPFTLESEHAVALNEVLTQVNFGAFVLEAAGTVRTRAFVIVRTHLRQEEMMSHYTCDESNARRKDQ